MKKKKFLVKTSKSKIQNENKSLKMFLSQHGKQVYIDTYTSAQFANAQGCS